MTSISIADCVADNGYLSEFANVDFHPLPHTNSTPDNEMPVETNTNSENLDISDNSEDLKSQISDLTRELNGMKAFMAEKLKQQVKILTITRITEENCPI